LLVSCSIKAWSALGPVAGFGTICLAQGCAGEGGGLPHAPSFGDATLDSSGAFDSSAFDGSSETNATDASSTLEAGAADASVDDTTSGAEGGGDVIDTQMNGKSLLGYQGWFGCPGDGSTVNQWQHWLQGNAGFQVDMWPDLSEFGPSELFRLPGITMPDGSPATVFSAFLPATVMRHFQWMHDYGLDGALLQRFLGEVQFATLFGFRNRVTANAMAAAQAQGRVFAIEYDLTGVPDGTVLAAFETDWMYLVDTLHVLDSPRYLRYGAKPALFVWGLGFPDRPITASSAAKLIAWLRADAPPRYRVAVVGGVPSHWRTLDGDSSTDPAWAAVYRSLDVVSPWSVGRFSDAAGADRYQAAVVAPDLAELTALGVGYLPVVFPGFSRHNLAGGTLNQIPRNGGAFYWRQVYNAMAAGATMLKTAMFDEMNEGTAMLKMQTMPSGVPMQAPFVTLDADGQNLRSDHYLSLAGAATRMVNGRAPLSASLPSVP
jgi:hypothetical protein